VVVRKEREVQTGRVTRRASAQPRKRHGFGNITQPHFLEGGLSTALHCNADSIVRIYAMRRQRVLECNHSPSPRAGAGCVQACSLSISMLNAIKPPLRYRTPSLSFMSNRIDPEGHKFARRSWPAVSQIKFVPRRGNYCNRIDCIDACVSLGDSLRRASPRVPSFAPAIQALRGSCSTVVVMFRILET
jgi:hypothetical protein